MNRRPSISASLDRTKLNIECTFEGRGLFLDFDSEAGILDEVDNGARSCLGTKCGDCLGMKCESCLRMKCGSCFGNEARFCQAKVAELLFISFTAYEEGCHGTTRTATRAIRISLSCSLSRRMVRTILGAVTPVRPAQPLQRAGTETHAAVRPRVTTTEEVCSYED
jgi:hypothetical protein